MIISYVIEDALISIKIINVNLKFAHLKMYDIIRFLHIALHKIGHDTSKELPSLKVKHVVGFVKTGMV